MPLLLALPLALVVFTALMLCLLPLSLWQRLRSGSARRLARPWLVRLNVWLTLASTLLFAAFALLASVWWQGAWWQAGLGWLAGLALGMTGHWLTRFEDTASGLYYTPRLWLVLGLTLLVALRISAGLVQGWQVAFAGQQWPASGPRSHAGLLAMAAVLLGHAGMYALLLDRRLRQRHRWPAAPGRR